MPFDFNVPFGCTQLFNSCLCTFSWTPLWLAALYYANCYLFDYFLWEYIFWFPRFWFAPIFSGIQLRHIFRYFLYAINFLSAFYNGQYSRTMLSIACVLKLPLKLHIQENLWRSRWEYKIKMDLTDILWEVWVYVAQYRGFCEHSIEPSGFIKFGEVGQEEDKFSYLKTSSAAFC